jgi:hypothetical protein
VVKNLFPGGNWHQAAPNAKDLQSFVCSGNSI